jgi:hypothetical protein
MTLDLNQTCEHCGRALQPRKRGRPQRFCCDAHRKAHSRINGQNGQECADKDPALYHPSESPNKAPSKPRGRSALAAKLPRDMFRWCGLALHLGRRKEPVLTLVADHDYPHMFRIRYPDGWTSTPANISRAKDAAYGHARLLKGEAT